MILDNSNTPKVDNRPWVYITPFMISGVISLCFSVYVFWFEIYESTPSPHGIGVLLGLMSASFGLTSIAVDRLVIRRVRLLYVWVGEIIALAIFYQYIFG